MNRFFLAALAVGTVFVFSDTASAQYHGRGCSVRGYSYSTPYITYRSYGPGTHISRYTPYAQTVRRNHTVTRSSHYRLPPTYAPIGYNVHPYVHPHTHFRTPYGYRSPYGRSGVSFNIRF